MTEVKLIRDYIDTLPQTLDGQNLSLHQLQSAFYVFFLTLGISVVVFLIEATIAVPTYKI